MHYLCVKMNPPVKIKPTGSRPPTSTSLCLRVVRRYVHCMIQFMWIFISSSHRIVSMVVADVLVPIWCQDICNHHGCIGWSVTSWCKITYITAITQADHSTDSEVTTTPHTSPLWVSYGVSIVGILEKNHCDMPGPLVLKCDHTDNRLMVRQREMGCFWAAPWR